MLVISSNTSRVENRIALNFPENATDLVTGTVHKFLVDLTTNTSVELSPVTPLTIDLQTSQNLEAALQTLSNGYWGNL